MTEVHASDLPLSSDEASGPGILGGRDLRAGVERAGGQYGHSDGTCEKYTGKD